MIVLIVMFFALNFIILLCVLLGIIIFEPRFDTIIIDGKEVEIMWYNSRNGRDWIVIGKK